MSTNDPIGDYLARLEAASAGLSPPARAELLDDIRAHLAEIEATSDDTAQVLNALDRLGSPEAIVAAAASEASEAPGDVLAPPTPTAEPTPGRIRPLDVITVGLLVGGTPAMLPLLGPFALAIWPLAAILLWASPTWTAWEKTLGTLVWPGGYLIPLMAVFIPVPTEFALPTWLGVPVSVLLVLAPIAVAVLLLRRAHQRAV